MYHMAKGKKKREEKKRKQIPYTNMYAYCVWMKAMNLSRERNEDIIWGQIFI